MCAVDNDEEKVRTDEKITSKRCLKVKCNIQAANVLESNSFTQPKIDLHPKIISLKGLKSLKRQGVDCSLCHMTSVYLHVATFKPTWTRSL